MSKTQFTTYDCETYVEKPEQPDKELLGAASTGRLEAIGKLIDVWGANVDCRNKMERTPLMSAASSGHYKCCLFLLQRGAQVNLVDDSKSTALMWSTLAHDVRASQLLIEMGSDVFQTNKEGYCFLDQAMINRSSVLLDTVVARDTWGRRTKHYLRQGLAPPLPRLLGSFILGGNTCDGGVPLLGLDLEPVKARARELELPKRGRSVKQSHKRQFNRIKGRFISQLNAIQSMEAAWLKDEEVAIAQKRAKSPNGKQNKMEKIEERDTVAGKSSAVIPKGPSSTARRELPRTLGLLRRRPFPKSGQALRE